jgi:hypothetical protein
MEKFELVITALQQRIGELVSNYGTSFAYGTSSTNCYTATKIARLVERTRLRKILNLVLAY